MLDKFHYTIRDSVVQRGCTRSEVRLRNDRLNNCGIKTIVRQVSFAPKKTVRTVSRRSETGDRLSLR